MRDESEPRIARPPTDVANIREAEPEDWERIWPFFHAVVRAGETFVYAQDLSFEDARRIWMNTGPARTVVATDAAGTILGTAKMGPNFAGPGAHVTSASFMVAPASQGRGIGRELCLQALTWAAEEGFSAMVFNAVVASNHAAIALYESLGFETVGRIPGAFQHPVHGLVDLLIMHHDLKNLPAEGAA